MMVVVGLIVLRISRTIAAMMRRRVGHNDDDALGLWAKRKAGGICERVELVLGNIAAAAGVQRADPFGEFVHVRGHGVSIFAVAIRGLGHHVIFEGHQAEAVVAIIFL